MTPNDNNASVFDGPVLLVEDNVIIAMDAEDIVRNLGATEVHTATTVDQAMEFVRNTPIRAAILDFNLENETSEPVARALSDRSIPFTFATGYSGTGELPGGLALANLHKPYTAQDIRSAFTPSEAVKAAS